jgi:RNA polymerase sigma-54 factor
MDDDLIPHLRISRYYRQRLMSPDATAEEKEFIKRKINAAQWLIESINQRRSTLTRVAQAICDYQRRFLDDGPEFIEPLKMEQIAEKVGVHVTTVSRAVDDKWIQTPRGIYPLRRFFVGGTKSADGEDVAWDAIRIKLQEIVDHEDKSNPYSDEDLVEQLAKQGLTVARRTVTKYRKKMDIPSSRQRRDWALVNGATSGATAAHDNGEDDAGEASKDSPEVAAEVAVAQFPTTDSLRSESSQLIDHLPAGE